MSIFATWLTIEDERQWIASLESEGIDAAVIRDGVPSFDDLDAPIIYQGSHVIPAESDPRGGSVDLSAIPGHVRFWRENPDAPIEDEPEGKVEPYLRLGVQDHQGNRAVVILTARQAARLKGTLTDWLDALAATKPH